MMLLQSEDTTDSYYRSVNELTNPAVEQEWIKEFAQHATFSTMEEMYEYELANEPASNLTKTEFDKLELIVCSSEGQRIDLHILLEQGEKAVLYADKDESNPFWNNTMFLLLRDAKGKTIKKFLLTDEYAYLYDLEEENKQTWENDIKSHMRNGNRSRKNAMELVKDKYYVRELAMCETIRNMTDVTKPHVHVITQSNN